VNPHDWFIEHRLGYATRALGKGDTATFEAHLTNCPECREEIARIEQDLRWLPMNVPPVAPHPSLSRRIVDSVLQDRISSRRRWVLPAGLAASLLLAAAGWYAGQRTVPLLETQVADLQRRTVALEDTLSVIRRAGRVLQAGIDMGERRGGLVIFTDETTHRWSVVVHGLPPAPPGTAYQFWFICSDGMVRGARVVQVGDRPMMFTTGMPERGGAVLGAALTVEPMAAESGPPRGKQLAHLML
jgi:Anti-sigma-K factor rskA, C-terminal